MDIKRYPIRTFGYGYERYPIRAFGYGNKK